mmetsp:Transcript_547/g.1333  ORF Transcript_547/g.1333 Transcript_547/m.1333 type:complete len:204 (+) Transcript_547:256-867(+)
MRCGGPGCSQRSIRGFCGQAWAARHPREQCRRVCGWQRRAGDRCRHGPLVLDQHQGCLPLLCRSGAPHEDQERGPRWFHRKLGVHRVSGRAQGPFRLRHDQGCSSHYDPRARNGLRGGQDPLQLRMPRAGAHAICRRLPGKALCRQGERAVRQACKVAAPGPDGPARRDRCPHPLLGLGRVLVRDRRRVPHRWRSQRLRFVST